MAVPLPSRRVLESVPKVAFYDQHKARCPEDICFPSCGRSLLEFLPDAGSVMYKVYEERDPLVVSPRLPTQLATRMDPTRLA